MLDTIKHPEYELVDMKVYKKDLDRIRRWISIHERKTGEVDTTEDYMDWFMSNVTDGEVMESWEV